MALITKEERLCVTRAQKCQCAVSQKAAHHHWDGKERQGEESRYPFLLRAISLQMLDLSRRKGRELQRRAKGELTRSES